MLKFTNDPIAEPSCANAATLFSEAAPVRRSAAFAVPKLSTVPAAAHVPEVPGIVLSCAWVSVMFGVVRLPAVSNFTALAPAIATFALS